MADTADVAVERALMERLRALTFSPATIEVAWPNVAFVPPVAERSNTWLRATFLPAPKVALGIDPGSSNQITGIFQVDVLMAFGSGELVIARIAQTIATWFARGTEMIHNNQRVRVNRTPFRGRMLQDSNWMIIPVSIPYEAFVVNPA